MMKYEAELRKLVDKACARVRGMEGSLEAGDKERSLMKQHRFSVLALPLITAVS